MIEGRIQCIFYSVIKFKEKNGCCQNLLSQKLNYVIKISAVSCFHWCLCFSVHLENKYQKNFFFKHRVGRDMVPEEDESAIDS